MNKPLFVVEGKDDYSKLMSLGLSYVVKTEGRFISHELFLFLHEASKVRTIVLLLDPDGPGMKIRERLKESLTMCEDVYVDKKRASAHRKIGVAETDFIYLKSLLAPYIKEDKESEEKCSFSASAYLELGLGGSSSLVYKQRLKKKYYIQGVTSKAIINQINILNLSPQQIKETIEDE